MLRTGVLPPVRRKIGKKTYVPRTKEFEDLEDMKGTLKDTAGNTAELLRYFFYVEGFNGIYRDQYDNVFRTGKIEPQGGKVKNRRWALRKVHNIYDKDWKTRNLKTMKKLKGGNDLIVK
jgi:hypothetical protein